MDLPMKLSPKIASIYFPGAILSLEGCKESSLLKTGGRALGTGGAPSEEAAASPAALASTSCCRADEGAGTVAAGEAVEFVSPMLYVSKEVKNRDTRVERLSRVR